MRGLWERAFARKGGDWLVRLNAVARRVVHLGARFSRCRVSVRGRETSLNLGGRFLWSDAPLNTTPE